MSALRTTSSRGLAWTALQRVDHDGAYANLVLSRLLAESHLDERDRNLVTELVYGTVRMRRACDHLVNRFCMRPPAPEIVSLLRLGAYQLHFTAIAPHAAVSETVSLAPKGVRPFVNAVLRKVASVPVQWPDDATRLSYPDWIVRRLRTELGDREAVEALEQMNVAAHRHRRDDGYSQDPASQAVAELVDAGPGDLVADLCAAPGGKATALAATGAIVVAADLQAHRVELIEQAAASTGHRLHVVRADATAPPLRPEAFDRVLLDAPCSGLGTLRRRPDARWRIEERSIADLAALQAEMLTAAAPLVCPGGVLVYSVCTLTAQESIDHDAALASTVLAGFEPLRAPAAPWSPYGRGGRLRPQDAGTDGMVVLRWQRRR